MPGSACHAAITDYKVVATNMNNDAEVTVTSLGTASSSGPTGTTVSPHPHTPTQRQSCT